MTLQEQVRKNIQEYNIELNKRCEEYNKEQKQILKLRIKELKEQVAQQKINFDKSKIKLPKFPICYDCVVKNMEELK